MPKPTHEPAAPDALKAALERAELAEQRLFWMERGEVAELLAVSGPRVSQMATEGKLPSTVSGRHPRAATIKAIAEHLRTRGDLSALAAQEKERKVALLDIALAKARNEVMQVEDVHRVWGDIVIRARDAFRRLGSKVSSVLPYCRSEAEMQRKIEDACDEILIEISRPVDY
jgi:hypothetical protein